MLTYFVTEENEKENLIAALSRMIEYVKFLEQETGRNNFPYSDDILDEECIEYKTEKIT